MEEENFIKLFDIFLSLNENNIKESAVLISKSPIVESELGITVVSQYFIRAFRVRPKNLDILAHLFVELLNVDTKNSISTLPKKFLEYVFSFTPIAELKTRIRSFYLLRKLIKYKVYKEKEIIDIIISEIENQENLKNYIFDCCFWAPEVEEVKPCIFNFVPEKIFEEIPVLKHFYANIEIFRKNDWEYFYNSIENEGEPQSFGKIFTNDDVNLFIKIASKDSFDFSQRISPTIFEHRTMFHRGPTLLQAACFAGAVKCVKFMLLNNVNVNEKDNYGYFTAQYAVCGGCLEIVKLLDQSNADFKGSAQLAIEYFRDSIYDWIVSTKSSEVWLCDMYSRHCIHNASISGNVRAFVKIIENGEDINQKFNTISPLVLSIKCNSFDIVKSIMKRAPELFYTTIYENLTITQLALTFAKDEMVQFLFDQFPDWNHWNGIDGKTNDLFCAIQARRTKFIPELAKRMKIAENPDKFPFLNMAINIAAFRPILCMANMGREVFPINYNLLPKNFNNLPMLINFLVKIKLIPKNRKGLPKWCQKDSVHHNTYIDIINQKAKLQPDPEELYSLEYNSDPELSFEEIEISDEEEEEELRKRRRLADTISFDLDIGVLVDYDEEYEEDYDDNDYI